MMQEVLTWLVTTAVGLALSAIGYFLKHTMDEVDEHGDSLREMVRDSDLKESTARIEAALKEATGKLEGDIRKIREDYTPKDTHVKDYDEVRKDIKQIKSDYLTKDDFIREINKMDRKLDRITEMMIEAARQR